MLPPQPTTGTIQCHCGVVFKRPQLEEGRDILLTVVTIHVYIVVVFVVFSFSLFFILCLPQLDTSTVSYYSLTMCMQY